MLELKFIYLFFCRIHYFYLPLSVSFIQIVEGWRGTICGRRKEMKVGNTNKVGKHKENEHMWGSEDRWWGNRSVLSFKANAFFCFGRFGKCCSCGFWVHNPCCRVWQVGNHSGKCIPEMFYWSPVLDPSAGMQWEVNVHVPSGILPSCCRLCIWVSSNSIQ